MVSILTVLTLPSLLLLFSADNKIIVTDTFKMCVFVLKGSPRTHANAQIPFNETNVFRCFNVKEKYSILANVYVISDYSVQV